MPPLKAGGGRGHQNTFDFYAAVWALALKEIFQIWPKVSCPVLLWDVGGDDKQRADIKTRCKLSDGQKILDHLRTVQSGWPPPPLVVYLLTGDLVNRKNEEWNRRFAEISIGPVDDFLEIMELWVKGAVPLSLLPTRGLESDVASLLRCIAVIQLTPLFSYVAIKSATL